MWQIAALRCCGGQSTHGGTCVLCTASKSCICTPEVCHPSLSPCPCHPPLPSPPATAYKSVRLSVQRLQLDDMLPGTPFPVVLAPALQQQQQATAGGAGAQPLLAVTWTSVAGGARGRSYLPLILVRWATGMARWEHRVPCLQAEVLWGLSGLLLGAGRQARLGGVKPETTLRRQAARASRAAASPTACAAPQQHNRLLR